MGKKNKAFDKLNPFEQIKARRKMADQFGMDTSGYSLYGPGGRPGRDDGVSSVNDFDAELAQRAANDYDVRRTLEAATMAGNKKAKNIGGINNIADAYQAHKFMKKTHHKRMENGGSFHGANDQLGVTNYWVEKDREKMLSDYASMDDLNALKKRMQAMARNNKDAREDASDPAEPSERLAQAQSRLGQGIANSGIVYEVNNSEAPAADDQADAARYFLDDYKIDVTNAAALRQDIKQNLSNASNTVTDVYGR